MENTKIKEFTDKVNQSINDILKRQKEIGDALQGKVDTKQLSELSENLKEVQDKLQIEGKDIGEYAKILQEHNNNLEARIKELEENKGGSYKTQSQLIYEGLKSALKEGRSNFIAKARTDEGIEIKANEVNFSNSFTENYYQAIPQDTRLPGIQQAPMPQPTVFNLMNPGVTSKRYVPYVERTGYTSGASMVDDTTAGGQADISFTDKQAIVKKISVKLYASRDSIDDVDYLQSEIQRLLNHDIVQKRENQLLTGTGTGNDLHGLIYSANPIAKPFAKPAGIKAVVEPSISDVLNVALAQISLGKDNDFETGYMANGIVLHPTQVVNMMGDRASDGHFRKHPLLSMDGRSFAGVPIVQSKFIDHDTFLVGDFRQARPFVRRNISLKILDQNASFGEEDVLTFVLTYRIAFFVPSPHDYAFVFGTFDSALSQLTKTAG